MNARLALTAFAVLVLTAPQVQAQYTWNGSASNFWSNTLNWSPSGGPPNAAGATATFNGTSGTVSIDAATTVGQISFNTPSSFTLALSGTGSLTLDNGPSTNSVLTVSSSTAGATVSANLTVGGNGILDLVSHFPTFPNAGLTLSGAVTASGGTVVIKQGLVIMTGANTYSSATQIDAGAVLRAAPGAGLSANSNLVFNGGQLQLPSGVTNFTLNVGPGPGQVRFTGSGGFVATSGTVNVLLNNSTATQTWGGPNFLPDGASLLLGLATASSGRINFVNGLDLNGGVRTVNAAGASTSLTHTLSGPISNSTGTGGLTKTGGATLELTGTNTYNGPTTVAGGMLAAIPGAGLSNASNLTLDGGVYAPFIGSSSPVLFTRSIGTGAGQVQWGPNSGGFAAGRNALTIRLNNNTGTLAWGSPGFVPSGQPLIFHGFGTSPVTGPSIDFQNGLDLNGATRTIRIEPDGSFDIVVRVSGPVVNTSGTPAGLTKTGTGTLELTGINTYDGPTVINGGVLRAAVGTGLPATGNLLLDNGVYEGIGNGLFNRSIGTAPGQVQWSANGGGLSAYNGTMTVQLNNGTGALAWGSAGFIPSGQPLIVGAYTEAEFGVIGPVSVLDFQNGINLNGATRTIDVGRPPATSGTTVGGLVRFTGPITNSGGTAGVTITGDPSSPVVEFAGANTYTGTTTVDTVTLRANPGQGLPNASNLILTAGGRLELTGPATFNRTIGTGAGQVQLFSSGLGAFNGTVAVQLNGGTGTLTWGVPASVFLPPGSSFSLTVRAAPGFAGQTVVDFQNGLNLNGVTRTISVFDFTTTPGNMARISGVISNSTGVAGLTITSNPSTVSQHSTLELTGANTYTGTTTVNTATLRAVDGVGLPSASNLTLTHGVYESPGTATFNRTLGTGAGQIQWFIGTDGGFSVGSGTLTVRLNNGTGTLSWGTANFVSSSQELVFGSRTAGGLVDFQNGLSISGTQSVELRGGVSVRLSGGVSGGGNLHVAGHNDIVSTGVLELTTANTYTGGTGVTRTTLMVMNTSGSGTGTGTVTVGLLGRLGGIGTIGGTVTLNSGTIRAGNLNGVGTLTINNGLNFNTTGDAGPPTLGVRLTGGTPSSTPGGSTAGPTLNPTTNNFIHVTFGLITVVGHPNVVIDGTGTTFDPGQPYSYRVGQAPHSLSWNMTDQSRFTTIGFTASNFALTGDAGGAFYVSFTVAPVPEPGFVLLCAAAGLVVVRRRAQTR
jgi:autotransporter-associated beta strand protein